MVGGNDARREVADDPQDRLLADFQAQLLTQLVQLAEAARTIAAEPAAVTLRFLQTLLDIGMRAQPGYLPDPSVQ